MVIIVEIAIEYSIINNVLEIFSCGWNVLLNSVDSDEFGSIPYAQINILKTDSGDEISKDIKVNSIWTLPVKNNADMDIKLDTIIIKHIIRETL